MSAAAGEVRIACAAVSDRGLSEKRPVNEDSFLADERRRIFVVCDGVGGAEAGEVASQTAVEVLDEAFRHHREGDDVEDLLEIAIQRANTSIHQMSRDSPRLSMMATTVVALHLDGRRATVGHVGDSRLYSVAPDGSIARETIDHSVVEEEVQAGRMTPQQAATHPSRNVISRALGAEASVEVDLKTIDSVADGTVFVLCSDGITRHIPDEEMAAVLANAGSLEAACDEFKRLCYERGAEDNLTAVLIRVGDAPARARVVHADEDERTLITSASGNNTLSLDPGGAPTAELNPAFAGATGGVAAAAGEASSHLRRPFNDAGGPPVGATSKVVVNADQARESQDAQRATSANPTSQSSDDERATKKGGGLLRALGLLSALAGVAALAFFGGMLYQRQFAARSAPAAGDLRANAPATTVVQTPALTADSYEQRRRAVDLAPAAEVERRTREMSERNMQPLDSPNPEFLYLYGRALLLTDRPREAAEAFARAVARADEDMTPENAQVKVEARVARVAALMRAGDTATAQDAAQEMTDVVRSATTQPQQQDVAPTLGVVAPSPTP